MLQIDVYIFVVFVLIFFNKSHVVLVCHLDNNSNRKKYQFEIHTQGAMTD